MSVDLATVKKVASLARLHVDAEKLPQVQGQINQILSWIEQLQQVDVHQTEPLYSVFLEDMPRRPDVVTDGGYADDIVANAPDTAFQMFAVPKVVE